MRQNNLTRRIFLGCIVGLGPIGAAVARDYLLITDPFLVGKGAGLDGLWGTGDTGEGDITGLFPGANPAGAASFSFDTSNFNALMFFSGVDAVADPIALIGQSNDVTSLSYTGNNVLGVASSTTLDPADTSTVTSTGLMTFSSNTHVISTVAGSLSFLNGVGIVLFNDGLRDDPSLVLSDPDLITAANFLKGLVDASHPDWTAITYELHCTSTVGCTQGSWTSKYSIDAAALAPIPAGVNDSGSSFIAATNTPFIGTDSGGGMLTLGGPTATESYEALLIGTESAGNKGVVAVAGTGASLTADSGIVVGERGDGTMRVSDGAVVRIDGNAGPFDGGPIGLTIANAGGSEGWMEVRGAGSSIDVTGPVIVGDGSVAPGFGIPSTASGTLFIDDGGQMNVAGSMSIGYNPLGSGALTVSGGLGTGIAFQGPDRALDVGLSGTGLLQVTDGAAVTGALFLDVGTLAGSTGIVNITGSGTHVDLTGVCDDCAAAPVAPGTGPYLWVGLQGNGSVTIADGASLTIDPGNGGAPLPNGSGFEVGGSSFAAGGPLTGTGALGVHGGSVLEVRGSTGYFSVGDGGAGVLTVSDGGRVMLENPDGLASGYIATTGTSSGTVQVQGADSLLNAGSFLAAGLDFNLADSGGDAILQVGNGGTIAADTIQLGTSAILRGNGGTLLGNLLNGGTVAPGTSPGTITVDGDYSQLPGGRLVIEIGGLAPGIDFDVLDVTGTASLDGTLEVVLINGFVPQLADVFQFLLAGSIEGGFGSLIFPIFNGRTFALDLPSGSLAVEAVPLPPALWLLVSAMLGLIGIGRRRVG
ncbi:MAG: hypothetical protein HONDAALG_04546 [Gammaproteobacteria bacterium]|nr:hypothetical protein [Gammaproteobacteria bacterium]